MSDRVQVEGSCSMNDVKGYMYNLVSPAVQGQYYQFMLDHSVEECEIELFSQDSRFFSLFRLGVSSVSMLQ